MQRFSHWITKVDKARGRDIVDYSSFMSGDTVATVFFIIRVTVRIVVYVDDCFETFEVRIIRV
jgi:hypothetical protein